MEIEFNFDEIETTGKFICDLNLLKKQCNWNLIEEQDHSEFHLSHSDVIFKMDCINYDKHNVIIVNSNTDLKYHDILESLSFLSMNLDDSYFWYLPEIENLQKKYTGSDRKSVV